MYDEEDEIGTGYLDDDFEEKNVSKRDRDRNTYDDKDDMEMVRYALLRTCTPSQCPPFLFFSILSVSNFCDPPSPSFPPPLLLSSNAPSSHHGEAGSEHTVLIRRLTTRTNSLHCPKLLMMMIMGST